MDSRRLVPLLVGGVLAVIAAALLAIEAGGASIEAWAVLFGYGLLALIVAQLPSRSGATDSSRASTVGTGGGATDSREPEGAAHGRDQLPDPHEAGFDAPLT